MSTGYVKSYGDGGSGNEQTMLDNFDNYGPIGVSVDASNWQFYDGGKTNGHTTHIGGHQTEPPPA